MLSPGTFASANPELFDMDLLRQDLMKDLLQDLLKDLLKHEMHITRQDLLKQQDNFLVLLRDDMKVFKESQANTSPARYATQNLGNVRGAHVAPSNQPNTLRETGNSILSEESEDASHEHKKAPISPWSSDGHITEMIAEAQRKVDSQVSIRTKKKDGPETEDLPATPMRLVARFVDSRSFQLITTSLILLNTVYVGFESNLNMTNALEVPPRSSPTWSQQVNRVFSFCFLLELLLRMIAAGRTFFVGHEKGWNLLDTFLLWTSILEESLMAGTSMSYMRIVRVLRLIKALRVIRMLRLFKELRTMTLCVLNALSAVMWAMLLLFMVVYIFAIVSMEGASQHFAMKDARLEAENLQFDPSRVDEDLTSAEELRGLITTMYRNLPRAMLTSFYCISGGISWGESLRPLMSISPLYAVVFSLYISFVVFGVLNVLTGLFVERAMSISDKDVLIQHQQDKNRKFLADMVELFHDMDKDGDALSVSWEELSTYLKDSHVIAYFQSQELDVTDARFIFDLLDSDGSGELTIDEFCVGCHRLRGAANCLDVCHVLAEICDIGNSIHDSLRQVKGLLGVQETEVNQRRDSVEIYLTKLGLYDETGDPADRTRYSMMRRSSMMRKSNM